MSWIKKADTQSQNFPAMGKYDMVQVDWGSKWGGKEVVEIGWWSAGSPRPTIEQAKEFVAALQEAIVFAEQKQEEMSHSQVTPL